MKWNLRHLRVFLAVVDYGSIRQAAKACHVSQPAVTQSNAKLESLAGTALFEHTSRGLFITEVGAVFAERVRRALTYLDPVLTSMRPRLVLTATATKLVMLITVCECQSFAVAARRLGVAQPTVHRAISQLEQEAGQSLFERTSLGIMATPQALDLAQAARLAFAELDQADAELGEATMRDVGRIVIGASRSSASDLLPRAIIRFRRKRPSLPIQVLERPYDDLLSGLRRGEIDFFLGALRNPAAVGDITERPLFVERQVLVCAPHHPLLAAKTITASDLARYPWVLNLAGTPTRETVLNLLAPVSPALPQSIVETDSMILVRKLLQGSDHLGCVSRLQVQSELERGIFAVLPYEVVQADRLLGLTLRASWVPTRAQSDFLAEIYAVADGP